MASATLPASAPAVTYAASSMHAQSSSHTKLIAPETDQDKDQGQDVADADAHRHWWGRSWHAVAADYTNYYRPAALVNVVYATFASAVLANSHADEHINDFYQRHFVTSGTNSVARVVKLPGYNSAILWYLGGAAAGLLLQPWAPQNILLHWSTRVLRSVLVGAPPVLILQRVLGSKRPNDGSQWRPFVSAHAVSGHAFLGSLPFLTAASMTDSKPLKILFYTVSTLPGWSRLNDNKHYFSQVIFGWVMGYLAVRSVNSSVAENNLHVGPYVDLRHDTVGLQATLPI